MKCVVTVVGLDKVGIIGRVCSYLSSENINILDISQTIIQGYFNMIMIVEIDEKTTSLDTVIQGLDNLSEDIGVLIKIQREDIFMQMHRI